MTDSVCIAVFVMMILTFGLGIVVGECLAIDSIAAKRKAKSRKNLVVGGIVLLIALIAIIDYSVIAIDRINRTKNQNILR